MTMGIYDIFRNAEGTIFVQLKVGECLMHVFAVGDNVSIGDGVYYGYEGVVVILDGKVESVTEKAPIDVPARLGHYTKWGGIFDASWDLDEHNPIAQAMARYREGRF